VDDGWRAVHHQGNVEGAEVKTIIDTCSAARLLAVFAIAALPVGQARAQAQAPTPPSPVVVQPPAPATKLEGFRSAAGTLVTLGYNVLDSVPGITADVREVREGKGSPVRGVVIDIVESDERQARAFIDADEVAALLKGIDALLAVKTNPTTFGNFEVQYSTRGALLLGAFNDADGNVAYLVEAGHDEPARRYLQPDEMRSLRAIFAAAQVKLAALGN
jgi:hypothetical protein